MIITKWNGKPITKPGWYSGIPIDRYHSRGICKGLAVSSTDLRTCWSKSAAHMFSTWVENPKAIPRKTTRAMILGAAAHHLFLGEDGFRLRFSKQPATYRDRTTAETKPWNGNAKPCRQWAAEQTKLGRVIVTQAELEHIVGMARSLTLEPLINAGILRGHIEVSGFFKHPETDLWVKVRPDVIPTDGGDYVDLKTAAEVTSPALQYAIRAYAYHQQAALIWEAVEVIDPTAPFQFFTLMFIETAPPYCARAVPVDPDDLARGRLQNRAMLRKIASCIREDHWPGPAENDLRSLPLATDERARIDARLTRELPGGGP